MREFIYYYPNGEIFQVMRSPLNDEPHSIDGMSYIEVDVGSVIDPRQSYVANNAVFLIPQNNDPYKLFDYTTKSWLDQRTLDQVKADKWIEVKANRELELVAPLSTPFGIFDASVSSQKSITDAVLLLQTMQAMGTPTTIDFTLADNRTVTLTTLQMIEVGLLLGQRTQTVFASCRAKRAAIEAATTAEAVNAVV